MSKVLEWIGKFLLLPLLQDLFKYLTEKWKEHQQVQAEKKEAEEKLKKAEQAYDELKKAKTEKEAIDAINKLP